MYKQMFTGLVIGKKLKLNTNMYIRKYNPDIKVIETKKSIESYNMVSKYLDNIISFDDYINNENLFQVSAFDKTNLVGVRIFRMKDNKIHLNYSVVDVDYRNIGINKMMFDKILEIAKKNQVYIITSNVRESNIYSLKSLFKSGFSINDRVDMKYPDGEKKIALYLKL